MSAISTLFADGRNFEPMRFSRVARAWLLEAKYEAIRGLRFPAFAAPFLVLPVALYLLFGVALYGGLKDRTVAVSLFTSFAVFGVMGPGMFGFGMFVAAERERGLLVLRRALPASIGAYLFAKTVMAVFFAAIALASVTAAAGTLGPVRFTAVKVAGLAGVLVPSALPFCALGLFIGSRAATKSAPAFVNLTYLPMVYLSGMIPLPPSLAWIERFSPAFYADQLAHRMMGIPSPAPAAGCVAVLATVTLIPSLFAVRRLARRG